MSRLATFPLIAALLLTAVPVQAQFGELSGLLGRAQRFKNTAEALRGIGEQEEIKIGSDLSAIILGAAPLVQDPDKQRYVNRLGRWLAMHGERPGECRQVRQGAGNSASSQATISTPSRCRAAMC